VRYDHQVGTERFETAIARIDAANTQDPVRITAGGEQRPKELVHSEMLTAWMHRLKQPPAEELLLAARAHHIRRWEHPRSEYPEGRGGYLRWRTALYRFHADAAAEILRDSGYEEATVARVSQLIGRRAPASDADAQTLEDGLCLVFLETQLNDVAGRLNRDKMTNILRRTWKKMSPAGRQHALELALDPEDRALIEEALNAG
jgi:hypothetical protein